MSLRNDVLMQRNAISADDLAFLMAHVQQAQTQMSLVSNFAAAHTDSVTDEVQWVVNRQIRDTQEVDLPGSVREKLTNIDDASVRAFIKPFYQIEVRDREPSQILHYGVGGHYIPHVDAETLYKDEIGLEMWEKTLDRDLSLVYFLNDDYTGGTLVFPALDLVIEPEAGLLVCFPSDHNFIHGVDPVTSGHRYTIVTWMRVEGTPSMDEINQIALDAYHSAWPKQIKQHSRLARGGAAARAEDHYISL